MKKEEMENLINNVREKIGDEMSGTIADDLALLMTDNVNVNSLIKEKDTEITKLKKDKENLISVNRKFITTNRI